MNLVGGNYGVNPQRRKPTGRIPNQKLINQRTIRDKMLIKAQQGNFTQIEALKNSLENTVKFKQNEPELIMQKVFQLNPDSTISTETGEISLKCFF